MNIWMYAERGDEEEGKRKRGRCGEKEGFGGGEGGTD